MRKITPLIEKLKIDISPETLFEALKDRPYSFFLDSASDCGKLGRFSFLGSDPFLVFRSKRENVVLERPDGKAESFAKDPFLALSDIFKKYDIENPLPEVPFVSGGVGYFAYDLKDFIEDMPDTADDDLNLPDSIFGFYDVVIIHDNIEGSVYLVSSGFPEERGADNRLRARKRLAEFKSLLEGIPSCREKHPLPREYSVKSNFTKSGYAEVIRRAKEYIKRGDIYQVNISQRFHAESSAGEDPYNIYKRLRKLSPGPFSSYLNFKDAVILSSSPERFLLKRGGYIETRPIKGTRPRGEDALEDALMESELISSDKDRAEHIMIVDLERNDLGRICKYGTVTPQELFTLERYSTVFHLVSTVAGQLREGITPIDCLKAAFPGGSITGAPKIRSMEIIEELEKVKRSLYTGSIGYISFDGNMDTSIVIRTIIIKGNDMYFNVGGGIVADSDPVKEYEETLHKARGIMAALGTKEVYARKRFGEKVLL